MKHIYYILVISVMAFSLFSCQGDELESKDNVGYLRVALEQSTEVNTKADVTYKPKQMRVVIKNADGVEKFATNDHTADLEGKELSLKQGEYTIEAVSYGWDGNSGADRAYYTGKTTVTIEKGKTATANLVCSLANVKVTVAFEQAFLDKLGNGSIKVQVKSATSSVTPVDFAPNGTSVAYFPVSDLTVAYTVVSVAGKTSSKELPISKVSAKDHYILNFKNQSTGTGNVTVTVDPTMNQYTYDFTVDPNAKNGATLSANPWSQFVYLTASDITLDSGELSSLKFQYRIKDTETWMDVATTVNAAEYSAAATLKGLTVATAYEYRLTDGEISVATGEFTTETEIALYNGSFDKWYTNGKIIYAIDQADATQSDSNDYLISFWDSGNPGASMGNANPTSGESTIVHTSGGMSAKLASQFVGIGGILGQFAAGNLYTGHFVTTIGTSGAELQFGSSFTSRPTQLHGYVHYTPGTVDYVSDKAPLAKGDTDQNDIYIALSDKSAPYTINTKEGTFINYDTDPNIIAYGKLSDADRGSTNNAWREFTIDLKYRDLSRQPKYIIIVASASRYGDYFEGSSSSVMYVDDFSLIYGDTPQVQE
ncbi:MAG: PCMD domain-containing protein [Parabacteroides sp.]|nr:PCMD domain-containing protein [Parabacteroides sp.]